MMKMIIEINEEKLKKDDSSKSNAFYNTLEEVFKQISIKYIKNNNIITIHSEDNVNYYTRFGKVVNILKRKIWFLDNVTSWKLYESYNDENKISEEDLLLRYKRE